MTTREYPMDTTVTDHLLSTTRAVRKRLDLDRPVDLDVVLECLRLAVQAPTGGNTQKWKWVIVTDAEKRKKLAEMYRIAGEPYFDGLKKRIKPDDDQTRRVYESAVYMNTMLEKVPMHVIPCIEGRVDGAHNAVSAGFYGSILPAVWSFMLAARSRGLGTVWTGLHLNSEAEAAELLGIPEGYSQVALIPVAYTTGGDFKPAARPPVETVTYLDTWGNTPPVPEH